jgi:hypothetical protein
MGSSASFTVAAVANEPISYAWCRPDLEICLVDSGSIAGSSTSTLKISPVTAGNLGSYFVDVSTMCGSVISNTVTLSVEVPTLSSPGVIILVTSIMGIGLLLMWRWSIRS